MLATSNDNEIRKAAVLIRSLDGEAAAAVFARLSADEARALRAAVRDLGDVSDDEQHDVAQALRETETTTAPSVGGVELSLGSSETYTVPAPVPSTSSDEISDVLTDADAETLVPFLRNEQPLTVAVVLSCLKPTRAAEVLAALPIESRPLVLDRLADLGDADPESLQVLTSGLRDWIADHQLRRQRRSRGLGAIEAILEATGDADRTQLLDATADRSWRNELPRQVQVETAPRVDKVVEVPKTSVRAEPEPTKPVVSKPIQPAATAPPLLIRFDQIEQLPAAAIAQILRHTPADHAMLALAAASEGLMKKITTTLPRQQAKALRQRLRNIGPLRLKDIEAAQHSLAATASELLRRGWIRTNTNKR